MALPENGNDGGGVAAAADGNGIRAGDGHAGNAQEDLPVCHICQDVMRPDDDLTCLGCPHTHHTYCLSEWHRLGRRPANECPLRCVIPDQVNPAPNLGLGTVVLMQASFLEK